MESRRLVPLPELGGGAPEGVPPPVSAGGAGSGAQSDHARVASGFHRVSIGSEPGEESVRRGPEMISTGVPGPQLNRRELLSKVMGSELGSHGMNGRGRSRSGGPAGPAVYSRRLAGWAGCRFATPRSRGKKASVGARK